MAVRQGWFIEHCPPPEASWAHALPRTLVLYHESESYCRYKDEVLGSMRKLGERSIAGDSTLELFFFASLRNTLRLTRTGSFNYLSTTSQTFWAVSISIQPFTQTHTGTPVERRTRSPPFHSSRGHVLHLQLQLRRPNRHAHRAAPANPRRRSRQCVANHHHDKEAEGELYSGAGREGHVEEEEGHDVGACYCVLGIWGRLISERSLLCIDVRRRGE